MDRPEITEALGDLLALSTMTLATCGADGEPHAADVYFAADQALRLYFFSDPESQHGQDLAVRSRAAVTFHPECRDWQDIQGLQMRGEVSRVETGPEWETAWELYQGKFPFVSDLKDIVARNTLYVFIPGWVRLVDNQQGFGFKQEWTLT
jgi:uncharacterized protein YhbP (UPF0306 family)